MRAAAVGKVEAIDALVAAGADLEIFDNGGYTALQYAAWRGHFDATKRLVAAGANLGHVNHSGFTAERLASVVDAHEIAEYLAQEIASQAATTLEDTLEL